jgi:hypothetical protein
MLYDLIAAFKKGLHEFQRLRHKRKYRANIQSPF